MKASIAPTKLHIDVIERNRDTSRRRGSDDASSNGRQNLLPSVFDVGDIPLADSNRARERFLGQLEALPDGSDVVLHAPILAPLFADSNSAARCQLTSATHNQHMTSRKAKIEPVHIEEAANLRRLFENREAPRLTQAAFGEKFEIGSQAVVWQYLNARIPLNMEKAVRFAKGLGCDIAEFSPRLADDMRALRVIIERDFQEAGDNSKALESMESGLHSKVVALNDTLYRVHYTAEDPSGKPRPSIDQSAIGSHPTAIDDHAPASTEQEAAALDATSETADTLVNAIELLLKGGGLDLDDLGGHAKVLEQIEAALHRQSALRVLTTDPSAQSSTRNLSWSDADLEVAIEPLIPTATPKPAKKQRAGTTRTKA